MPINTSEANLETTIERVLLTGRHDAGNGADGKHGVGEPQPAQQYQVAFAPGGYESRKPGDYDRELCLDVDYLAKFVQATQPEVWAKYKRFHKQSPERDLALGVSRLIQRRGTLHALRKGYRESGCQFRLVYFRPHTTLNPELQKKYQGNLFSVVRQLRYRPKEDKRQPELDLVLFLNGLPLFTAELKNRFTGQNFNDAIKQYRRDRDPREPLLQLGRCLAHFAVDSQLVYFATQLAGEKTRFFPFNKGYNNGAGNPPVHELSARFANSYLWEEVWSRDSVLNLLQQFIRFYEVLDDAGRKTGKKALIFPRYHQLTAVRGLIDDSRARGPGQRYLIQHSAGSGKTFTIAWLAHQLSTLHDENDNLIFDSVIVISDRRVLDQQLQNAMRDFEQKRGVVENIDQTSRQLKQALEEGKKVIVTTLQKFPVISRQMGELSGQNFAVIVDEAHSSQSGASVQELNRALSRADQETADEEEGEDMEDVLVREMALRRHLQNVSTYAFTATPKEKTLQLFGRQQPGGSYAPFSLYPMRQAIDEKFIMDVLEHYTTYQSYFRLLKKVEEDPRYDKQKAMRLLMRFVDDHPRTIERKTAIIVEHFHTQVAHRMQGKAKAMIVTRSRAHAVRFKQAVDALLEARGYAYGTLVAFSGKVTDSDTGIGYTETEMNTRAAGEYIPESKTAEAFERPDFRLLIVANKYQTGFDQPLLHTMYVDKRLGGVNAVQTLSRLNRTHPDKQETMVLDFVNEAEEIQRAFEPYYEATILSKGTDPQALYTLQSELEDFHFYDMDEVDQFMGVYLKGEHERLGDLYSLQRPVVDRIQEADVDEQLAFRDVLRRFVRLYAFLSQVLPFVETDWEKLFHFGRLLLAQLTIDRREQLPLAVQQDVDMEQFRLQETFDGRIALQRGKGVVNPKPPTGAASGPTPEEMEALSIILEELNRLGGIEPTEDNKAAVRQLQAKLVDDAALQASFRVNAPENARLTFEQVAASLFEEMIEDNFSFYKHVTDDPTMKRRFFDWLFEQYRGEVAEG